MGDFLRQTLEALEGYWLAFSEFAPRAIVALLLLAAGWVLARVLRRVIIKVLRKLRIDEAA
jgi:hypothetical protein